MMFEWILHENENLPNGENWAKKASTKFWWTDALWKQAKKRGTDKSSHMKQKLTYRNVPQ